MATIIVLTEEALSDYDVTKLRELYSGATFHVLVPADTERNVISDIINHLSLFELREAWEALTERTEPAEARQEADEALATTLRQLTEAGLEAEGYVVPDDPLPAVTQAVNNLDADELVVITRPHAVEDTFHADWASRAREELGLPVLHLYAGMNRLG
ncbi:universal stress protein [Ruania zhangjianzhongii]|uniref:universal stress protein n=1 Tax=Ruania zhangjianzhongii TaxID=2603206 RepID=UPI0011C86BCA|nr:universal stress protein [Ruania zhangjianzhongii]